MIGQLAVITAAFYGAALVLVGLAGIVVGLYLRRPADDKPYRFWREQFVQSGDPAHLAAMLALVTLNVPRRRR